ncbi:hypothetical protein PAPHI01_0758 [Pancytospora philotis]|nr:hypothetical protein PAPHI01_0758 [Pancytospora philotis]
MARNFAGKQAVAKRGRGVERDRRSTGAQDGSCEGASENRANSGAKRGPKPANGVKPSAAEVPAAPKGKKSEKNKLMFTRENINSHLLNYTASPGDYKLLGLVTYLFKEFKSTPEELLAKLKVLTSNSAAAAGGATVGEMIMRQLFVIFNVKDLSYHASVLKLLESTAFLTVLLSDMYFSMPMSEKSFSEHFASLFDEILRRWETRAPMSYAEFAESLKELEAKGDLALVEPEEGSCCDDSACAGHSESEMAEEEVFAEGLGAAAEKEEESSYSLVSLDDEAEINRLDAELGKIFSRNTVSEEATNYSVLLVNCLEKMIVNSYVTDIDFLYRLFYLYHFEELCAPAKAAIKSLMAKFGDKQAVFAMYQRAALLCPQLYSACALARSDCQESFDEAAFIKVALNFGHEGFVIHRVSSAHFYELYMAGEIVDSDDLLATLVGKENDMELLEKLQGCEAAPAELVAKRIAQLKHRATHPRKKDKKKERKQAEAPVAAVESETVEAESAEEASEESAVAEPVKKRTFADKVGSKLVKQRDELKKKYRWENLKQKKKNAREEKQKAENGENVRITKRSLREEEANSRKKGSKKQKRNK